MGLHVEIDHERVADFRRRNPIRRLAFFGSVLREDFGPRSDVDVLVELTPQARVTLLDMVGLQVEPAEVVGRRVDLRIEGFLSQLAGARRPRLGMVVRARRRPCSSGATPTLTKRSLKSARTPECFAEARSCV